MARAWHLKSRPQGMPTADNFELKEVELPPLADGMIRVRNRWLSVDPYMRGRMNDVKSYVPPFQLGEPMDGGAVGEVVESRADGFAPGDLVQHMARLARRGGGFRPNRQKLPDLGADAASSSSAFSESPARPPISGCSMRPRRRKAMSSSSRPPPARSARSSYRSPRPGA